MRSAWQRYVLLHVLVFAAFGAFVGYAFLVKRIFARGFFHCAMHDILHLYCPLCGGTRAVRAVLALDLRTAVSLCPTVLFFLPVALVFDLCALTALLRGRPQARLFHVAWRTTALWLLFGTAFRNVLLFLGKDPAGDLAAFWAGRLAVWQAAIAGVLLFLAAAFFYLAIDTALCERLHVGSLVMLLGALAVSVALFAVLSECALLLLLWLPIVGAFAVWRKRAGRDGARRA